MRRESQMINSKRKNILLTSVLCFNVLATAITPTAVMADTVTNNNLKATKSVVSAGNADHALLSIVSGNDVNRPINLRTLFPDDRLRSAVVEAVEKLGYKVTTSSNNVTWDQLLAIHELEIHNTDLKNLDGIEWLVNLESLDVSDSGLSGTLVLKNLSALKNIDISRTKVMKLDTISELNVHADGLQLDDQVSLNHQKLTYEAKAFLENGLSLSELTVAQDSKQDWSLENGEFVSQNQNVDQSKGIDILAHQENGVVLPIHVCFTNAVAPSQLTEPAPVPKTDPEMTISHFKIGGQAEQNDSKNLTLFDDTKDVSFDLKLSDGVKRDYVFVNKIGTQNVVPKLVLGGTLFGANQEVTIDDNDNSLLHVKLTGFDSQIGDDFSIAVAENNSRFNQNFVIAGKTQQIKLQLDANGVKSDFKDGEAPEEKPHYTANITVKSGLLVNDLNAGDISFGGVFSDAKIEKLTTDITHNQIVVQFSHPAVRYMDQSRNGQITIKNGLGYADKQNRNVTRPITVNVTDPYRPKLQYDNSTANTSNINGTFIAQTVTNSVIKAVCDTLKEYGKGAWLKANPLLTGMSSILFSIFGDDKDPVIDKLNEMDKKLDDIKAGIDRLSTAIMDGNKKAELASSINQVELQVRKLLEPGISARINNAGHAINRLKKYEGDVTNINDSQTIDDYFRQLYSTGRNGKNTHYEDLRSLQDFMYDATGMNVLTTTNSIMNKFAEYQSYEKDFSTQAAADRKQFDTALSNAYEPAYITIMAAIQYDRNKIEQEDAAADKWADQLADEAKKDPTQKAQLEITVAKIKSQIQNDTEDNIKQDNKYLDMSDKPNENSMVKQDDTFVKNIEADVNNIKKIDDDLKNGKIYSYRLKKDLNKTLGNDSDLHFYKLSGKRIPDGDCKITWQGKSRTINDICNGSMPSLGDFNKRVSTEDIKTLVSNQNARANCDPVGANLVKDLKSAGFVVPSQVQYYDNIWNGTLDDSDYDKWGPLFDTGHLKAKVGVIKEDSPKEVLHQVIDYNIGSFNNITSCSFEEWQMNFLQYAN